MTNTSTLIYMTNPRTLECFFKVVTNYYIRLLAISTDNFSLETSRGHRWYSKFLLVVFSDGVIFYWKGRHMFLVH